MAADTVGIRVLGTRYAAVIMGGFIAGIGGAYLTIGSSGNFAPNISSGYGYIALAALIFGLSGYLYNHAGTLSIDKYGGLLRRLPFIGTVMIMAMFAGCGLPGFANFPGELLVLFGVWGSLPWFVVAAAWGALIIAAIYMLRAVRDIWHGPLAEEFASLRDASLWRKVPFALLLAALLLFGVFPKTLTDKIEPSARSILDMAIRHDQAALGPSSPEVVYQTLSNMRQSLVRDPFENR